MEEIEEMTEPSPVKVLVSAGLTGAECSQAGVAILQPGESIPEEGFSSHGADEISFLLRGDIRLETKEEKVMVESRELVFMPAGKPHRTTNTSDQEAYVIWFASPPIVEE